MLKKKNACQSLTKNFQRVGKKATVYAISYLGTCRFLLAKLRWIFLETEAIGVEAEAVCKYTASTSLVKKRLK